MEKQTYFSIYNLKYLIFKLFHHSCVLHNIFRGIQNKISDHGSINVLPNLTSIPHLLCKADTCDAKHVKMAPLTSELNDLGRCQYLYM